MANPTGKYASIVEICVDFGPNPRDKLVQEQFNVNYGDAIANHGRLFTDPDDREEVLSDSDLTTLIRQIVTNEMIEPNAIETDSGTTKITPIISAAALLVLSGSSYRRLNKASLSRAMDVAIKNNEDTIHIRIGTSLL